MTTYSALTTMPGEETAIAISEALEAVVPEPTGIGVFEMEDGSGLWEVGAYFDEQPDEIALAVIAGMHDVKPFVVSLIPDQDWVAHVKRELAPVQAGRFYVHGSHDADTVPEGSIPLLIEAAMAFGTGHHGTTLGCLKAFDRILNAGFDAGRIIDVGCGTAVLAMAAARSVGGEVLASDIDPVAVDVARANVVANGLEGRVRCVTAAGFDAPDLKESAPYDLIFANILKGPLIGLAPDMAKATKSGGYVILSGILNEQAADVIAVYASYGYNLAHHDQIVEWSIVTMTKAG